MSSRQPFPMEQTITLSHGSGGRDMQRLLQQLVFPILCEGHFSAGDAAALPLSTLNGYGDRLAYTTDSYTITPLFFPGGDIGSLAVNGTVNDLAVSGARPLYLSCALIIEEGFAVAELRRILLSMRAAADRAGVRIVTGDTKVVHRGAADGLFINTSGIGVIDATRQADGSRLTPGDAVIVSRQIGDHGAAILAARGDLQLDLPIESDCQPLHGLVDAIFDACPDTRILRDATRGGVATVLNELVQSARVGVCIREDSLPIHGSVRGACELLGLDPLYLANEGTLVAVVPGESAETVMAAMRAHPAGAQARQIGEVVDRHHGMVSLCTLLGGERALDIPAGELLPRIC